MNPFILARYLLNDSPAISPETRKTVEGWLRARDIASLCSMGKIRDQEYQDHELQSLLALRQIAVLFKKNASLEDSDTCTMNARKAFEWGEKMCSITNKRLDHFYWHRDRLDPQLDRWLHRMEMDLLYLFGDVDEFVSRLETNVRLTSGATEDRSRKRALPFLKISGRIKAPPAAVPLLGRLLKSFGVDLATLKFTSVIRNVIKLVPKNWETYRTIAAEATHAMGLQLAVDRWLKGRLRRWGIDLHSQTKNQELAREGSLDGSLATIDLKGASDSLALHCAGWLLPPAWYELLCSVRASEYMAPWGEGVYNKLASMGNGYTFSVESAIFGAAVRAVGSRRGTVYGDDIVIESELAPSLIRLLRFLGFKTNVDKTFMNPLAPFRESCGCDYVRGRLVTPWYMRECPKWTDRASVSHVLNSLLSISDPDSNIWTFVAEQVKLRKLALVPWNEDTRTGVFVTPSAAWRTGILKTDRRLPRWHKGKTREGLAAYFWKDNPNYGFPVYKGYGLESTRRKVSGWRSALLWHLQKCYGEVDTADTPRSLSSHELWRRDKPDDDEGTATVTSSVVTRSRYVTKTNRYNPKLLTPAYVYVFTDVVLQDRETDSQAR
jgi:hypothetical protein